MKILGKQIGRPKKVTTYNEGKEVETAPAKIPELEVPRPPAEEPQSEERVQPAPEEADYFESAREYGFIEGISFAISTLRQAQNDLIRRQRGQ